jgi:hypothetical protein
MDIKFMAFLDFSGDVSMSEGRKCSFGLLCLANIKYGNLCSHRLLIYDGLTNLILVSLQSLTTNTTSYKHRPLTTYLYQNVAQKSLNLQKIFFIHCQDYHSEETSDSQTTSALQCSSSQEENLD